MPGATPYLDRQLPMPRSVSFHGNVFVIVIAFGVTLATAWHFFPILIDNVVPATPLMLIPVGIAVIAIHELGHLLAGLASGFRFQELRISGIVIHRTKGVSFQRGPLLTFITGHAKLYPPPIDKSRFAYAAMTAAGPFANLSSAAIAAMFPPTPASVLFIVVSLAIALGDLLPFETIQVSDGGRLGMLLFNRPRRERWLAIIRLNAESSDCTEPQKLSPELLATAIAIRDKSMDTVTAHAIAYSAALCRREFAHAGEVLDVCMQYAAHARPRVREALISDAAVYQAAVRHSPALAAAWLNDLPPKAKPSLRTRAEAAILASGAEPV